MPTAISASSTGPNSRLRHARRRAIRARARPRCASSTWWSTPPNSKAPPKTASQRYTVSNPTAGARAFRYEDGYYKGDFAKKETSYWRQYFSSLANAYGEDYDGYYSGWKSSMDLEVSADGFYYYDVTFWDVSMANETFEVIYMAYDADGVPGVPACYTVTLPAEIPAVTPQQAPSAYKAAVAAANRLAHPQALPRRR